MRRDSHDPEYMKVSPDPLLKFRDCLPTDEVVFPELSKNRRCTNFAYFVVFIFYIIAMIVFSAVIFWHVDLRKEFYGTDNCGNICGIKNRNLLSHIKGCKLMDYTNYPTLFYSENGTQCIKTNDCKGPDWKLVFGRCFKKNLTEFSSDIKQYGALYNVFESVIALSTTIGTTLGQCFLIYVAFYVIAKITLYVVILGGIIVVGTTCAVCWYMYMERDLTMFLVPAILTLIYLSCAIILLIFLSNRFNLIARLLGEAAKMIFRAPVLLIQPAITIGFISLLNGAMLYPNIVFKYHNKSADSTMMMFERVRPFYLSFLTFAIYWMYAFVNGCQYMIIACTVAFYYFSRKESPPRLPYFKSIYIILNFHLGTIAAGALVITFLRGLAPITTCLKKNRHCLKFLKSCSETLSETSAYLTKKAYAMTALHGRSIYPSGRRVARLSWLFMCNIISIDQLACAVMHAISFFFMLCATGILFAMITPIGLHFPMVPIIIGILYTGHITFFYASLMNVVVETMVICFCEDRLLNSGTRYEPYFMTSEFFLIMVEALDLAYAESSLRSE